MDSTVYFILSWGIVFFLSLAVIKAVLLIRYKGINLRYILFNFFQFYRTDDTGMNSDRLKFRKSHNLLTVFFYITFIAWLVVKFVVALAFAR